MDEPGDLVARGKTRNLTLAMLVDAAHQVIRHAHVQRSRTVRHDVDPIGAFFHDERLRMVLISGDSMNSRLDGHVCADSHHALASPPLHGIPSDVTTLTIPCPPFDVTTLSTRHPPFDVAPPPRAIHVSMSSRRRRDLGHNAS